MVLNIGPAVATVEVDLLVLGLILIPQTGGLVVVEVEEEGSRAVMIPTSLPSALTIGKPEKE